MPTSNDYDALIADLGVSVPRKSLSTRVPWRRFAYPSPILVLGACLGSFSYAVYSHISILSYIAETEPVNFDKKLSSTDVLDEEVKHYEAYFQQWSTAQSTPVMSRGSAATPQPSYPPRTHNTIQCKTNMSTWEWVQSIYRFGGFSALFQGHFWLLIHDSLHSQIRSLLFPWRTHPLHVVTWTEAITYSLANAFTSVLIIPIRARYIQQVVSVREETRPLFKGWSWQQCRSQYQAWSSLTFVNAFVDGMAQSLVRVWTDYWVPRNAHARYFLVYTSSLVSLLVIQIPLKRYLVHQQALTVATPRVRMRSRHSKESWQRAYEGWSWRVLGCFIQGLHIVSYDMRYTELGLA